MDQQRRLIDKLQETSQLAKEEWVALIQNRNQDAAQYLFEKARRLQHQYFGNKIYTRGLIEFTNYCKNDCYYCGIRRSNKKAQRYRLSREQIMECCQDGYGLGFRTFVLQGGEDGWFTQEALEELVDTIKTTYPDCGQGKAMRGFFVPGQTVTCYGMRRRMRRIMRACIPRNCPQSDVSNVFGI